MFAILVYQSGFIVRLLRMVWWRIDNHVIGVSLTEISYRSPRPRARNHTTGYAETDHRTERMALLASHGAPPIHGQSQNSTWIVFIIRGLQIQRTYIKTFFVLYFRNRWVLACFSLINHLFNSYRPTVMLSSSLLLLLVKNLFWLFRKLVSLRLKTPKKNHLFNFLKKHVSQRSLSSEGLKLVICIPHKLHLRRQFINNILLKLLKFNNSTVCLFEVSHLNNFLQAIAQYEIWLYSDCIVLYLLRSEKYCKH